MRNKRAVMGESILMIYRIVLVTVIALVVIGISAVYYDFYIDVRDAEAIAMTREVVDCVSPAGIIDLNKFAENENNFLEACGFDSSELNRFYVSVEVFDSTGEEIKKLEQGDSGAIWIKELFEGSGGVENIKKYRPGSFGGEYSVLVKGDNIKKRIKVEVLVNHEF